MIECMVKRKRSVQRLENLPGENGAAKLAHQTSLSKYKFWEQAIG
jgi:hypothetical protein